MTEAHETEAVFLVLGLVDVLLVVGAVGLDHLKYLEDALVGAAVEGSPERADAGRDGGIEVGVRGADHAHGGRRAVLLVVDVQDEEGVDGLLDGLVDLVGLARVAIHQRQEVTGVAQARGRVSDGAVLLLAVDRGGERLELRDQRDDVGVGVVSELLSRGRERGDGGLRGGHRVDVPGEIAHEREHGLGEDGLGVELGLEGVQLRLRGERAPDHHVRDLLKGQSLRELLDRVAAVVKHTLFTVDERDRALARARVPVPGIERDRLGTLTQRERVDAHLAFGPHHDRQFILGAIEGQLRSSHSYSLGINKVTIGWCSSSAGRHRTVGAPRCVPNAAVRMRAQGPKIHGSDPHLYAARFWARTLSLPPAIEKARASRHALELDPNGITCEACVGVDLRGFGVGHRRRTVPWRART